MPWWPGLIALVLLLSACATPALEAGPRGGMSAASGPRVGMSAASGPRGGMSAAAGPRGGMSAASGPPVEVRGLPFFPQEEGHCGPAALATVLTWSGRPVTPAETGHLLFTPGRGGSLQHDLVTAAARLGAVAVPLRAPADLLVEVEAGSPVLVLQNLGLSWWPVWHYAVVSGFDPKTGDVLLRSGREPRRRVSLPTFARTWARAEHWALLVLPAGELPARADEGLLLHAAATLERVGRQPEAEAVYAAMLARWPASRGAVIGLANVRYAADDAVGARTVLQRGVMRHPRDPVLWNNLAHVLNAPGGRLQALAAASRAVALDGDRQAIGRQTRAAVIADLAACRDGNTPLATC